MKIPFFKDKQARCIAGIVAVPTTDNRFILYVLWEWEKPAREGRFKGYKNYVSHVDADTTWDVMSYGKAMTKEEYEQYFPTVLKAFHAS
jgi:hypothetical protein